ncbi:hypothetical protein O9G_006369, partial [Rozella allomycis CSF55]
MIENKYEIVKRRANDLRNQMFEALDAKDKTDRANEAEYLIVTQRYQTVKAELAEINSLLVLLAPTEQKPSSSDAAMVNLSKMYSSTMTLKDTRNIDAYWRKFSRICATRNLNDKDAIDLLAHLLHTNEPASQWLSNFVKLNPSATLNELKDGLFKQYLSPYWKTTKLREVFKLEYRK